MHSFGSTHETQRLEVVSTSKHYTTVWMPLCVFARKFGIVLENETNREILKGEMTMSRLSIFVCLGILITFSACGDDPNPVCALPDVQECDCSGEPSSFQLCTDDGTGWRDCDCPPAPNNALAVTIGNLMWQTTLGPSVEPSAAVTYCEGETEGGHSDWRLPTRAEFETFFRDCPDSGSGLIRCEGDCNEASFCSEAPVTWYRTSTAAGSGQHYIVNTGNGFILPLDDTYSASVICVRDAP